MQITHTQLRQILLKCYTTKIPLDIKGPMGIGKSQVVLKVGEDVANYESREFVNWNDALLSVKEQVADNPKKYFIYADMRLSQMDPTDLKGFPRINEEHVKWVPNWIFKIMSNPDAKGILFFDELNLAPESVQSACFSIINDYQIGETPISKGVFIVSAGNRVEDNDAVFEESAPLNNRRFNVELQAPSADEWADWAFAHNIDSRVIGYLKWRPEKIFVYDKNSASKSFPTPRSWAKLGTVLKDVKEEKEILLYACAAVGDGVGRELSAYCKLSEQVEPTKQILENPKLMEKYKNKIDLKYSILSAITYEYKLDNSILEDVLKVCAHVEPDFGVYLIRSCKSVDAKPETFNTRLKKTKTWQTGIGKEYVKYMISLD